MFSDANYFNFIMASDSDKAAGKDNESLAPIEDGIIVSEKLDKLLYPSSFNIASTSNGAGPICLRTKLSGWGCDLDINKYLTSYKR